MLRNFDPKHLFFAPTFDGACLQNTHSSSFDKYLWCFLLINYIFFLFMCLWKKVERHFYTYFESSFFRSRLCSFYFLESLIWLWTMKFWVYYSQKFSPTNWITPYTTIPISLSRPFSFFSPFILIIWRSFLKNFMCMYLMKSI